jgi:hypothetical protein
MDYMFVDKRLNYVNVLKSCGCMIGSDNFLVVAKMSWRRKTRYE